ncbi:MAG TPA: squalene/phytoene synthase family protein [Pseudolabrys sp.]|nr:squalene/phytoene synthase family protein [Pseudolabrys sp.]
MRGADRDRFLATLFAPAERRGGLFALYAFASELARIRDLAREPLPGEIRLQWWREVLEGERPGEAAAHPVAAALLATTQRYGLATEPLLGMIEARSFDIYGEPMRSLAELEAYAAATEGALIAMATCVLEADVSGQAMDAGAALSLVGVLTALPRHLARRQLYIPLDVLQRHSAIAEDLFAGKVTAGARAALVELRIRARQHLSTLGKTIAELPTAVLPAFLPLASVAATLNRMDRADYDPLRPPEPAAWRRQWRIWRAARNPRRIVA